MSMLCARQISVNLRGRQALSRVDASIEPGLITAIIGPNGAGKSTLLRCLAGLVRPDAGEVALSDRSIAGLTPRDRARRIGYLPQTGDVHWDVEARALVALGRLPFGGTADCNANAAAIDAAMAATATGHLRARVVNRLSGGERARVQLARVLAGTPQVILADEPFASLDPAHQISIASVLKASAERGTAVAIVLHDLNLAMRIADRVILLRAGVVLAAGARDDVMTQAHLTTAYDVPFRIVQAGEDVHIIAAA